MPEEAVEALARAQWEWMRIPEATPWESLHLPERKEQLRYEARRDLEVAMPHFFSALLSDEVVEAARIGSGVRGRLTAENMRKALQAAIEQVGGGQGGC